MTRCDGCLLPLPVIRREVGGVEQQAEDNPGISLVNEEVNILNILQFHDGDCLADWCRANNFYGRMELPIRGGVA